MVCLLKRKNEIISSKVINGPLKVIVEHYTYIQSYLNKNYQGKYELSYVIGSSESFIVNDIDNKYHLCDAIVETGNTLTANNMEIHAIVKPKGELTIGLYM